MVWGNYAFRGGAALLSTMISGPALAQDQPLFGFCNALSVALGDDRYSSRSFLITDIVELTPSVLDRPSDDAAKRRDAMKRKLFAESKHQMYALESPGDVECVFHSTMSAAQATRAQRIGWIDRKKTAVRELTVKVSKAVARPDAPLKPADASIKSLALSFRSAVGPRTGSGVTGYQRADFKLSYKALLCAGEVQIAYSVDRKSLRLGTYQIAWGNEVHNVTPLRAAPMPLTVPLLATVRDGPARRNIGQIDDKVAGESLGMGCFTGQTKSIGKASILIGANATPEAIRKYLDAIYLDAGLGALSVYLRHPDIVAPRYVRDQEIKGPRFRELNIPGTTQGGAPVREAVVAPEPSRPLYDPAETARNQAAMVARQAEAEAKYKAQAAYPVLKAEVEARNAAAAAKAVRERAAYEASMAEWRRRVAACNAGDRASCAP